MLRNSTDDNLPHCLACLSHDHLTEPCLLYMNPSSRPSVAFSSAAPTIMINSKLSDIADIDFSTIHFPNKQTGEQFDDYFETVISTMFFAKDQKRQHAAEQAVFYWSKNYKVEGSLIRRIRKHVLTKDSTNQNPEPPIDPLEAAARRAAALGPDARVSDVTKTLRSSPPLPLTEDFKFDLKRLYPSPDDDDTIFEPAPIADFSISKHKVARYIMSRSRRSHPGMLGFTYGILQLLCTRWYKRENRDNPDPRWTLFCAFATP
jgi:hypothetical protein